MLTLGIESTCDETAAAIVRGEADVLSNVIATQFELHARFRGVVPEIASRAHIENILPVIQQAVDEAGITFSQIDVIAVAHRPGLIGSLLIGVTAAKTLAWALNKPLIGVDHVQAHLYSVNLNPLARSGRAEGPLVRSADFPAVGLVCSGGHTALYHINSHTDVKQIGSTIDDAVGEAYDKVAAILGLGFPGGPIVDALAQQGNPKAINFPRSRLNRESLDFSFSGLKTSVLYQVRGYQGREKKSTNLSEQETRDIAASFQAACVDVLIEKIKRAIRQTNAKSVIIGGGVSANSGLRAAAAKLPIPVHFPAMQYCTDNAAMIAGLGAILFQNGQTSPLDLDALTYSELAPT